MVLMPFCWKQRLGDTVSSKFDGFLRGNATWYPQEIAGLIKGLLSTIGVFPKIGVGPPIHPF